MALSWMTYRAIPTLRDYNEAKQYHDDIVPIRGDEFKTRPAGRRNQKWFSIWESKDAIHVGYGGRGPENNKPLVTYSKAGSIIVTPCYRGASTNERMSRLLDVTFGTHQYDTWARCHYYDNGELKHGVLPLRSDGPNVFVRGEGNNLVFVNYAFPKTHKVNRQKMKAKMMEFSPFIQYLKGLWKLSDGRPTFSEETRKEAFGMEFCPYRKIDIVGGPPNLRWGGDVDEKRAMLFNWAASTDPMDQLRAAITLSYMSYSGANPIETLKEYVVRTYKEAVLDVVEHRDGKLVKDRLKRFLI